MKPNPWIVHLQKNKGKGLTMEQLSQTYATSKKFEIPFHKQNFCKSDFYLVKAKKGLLRVSNDNEPLHIETINRAKENLKNFLREKTDEYNIADYNPALVKYSYRVKSLKEEILNPTGWLSDNVISFFGELFENKYDIKYVNTFFIPELLNMINDGNFRDWQYKKGEWKEKSHIFIPFHKGGNHWTLFVIFPKEHRIEYFDSLRDPVPYNLESKILEYLVRVKNFVYAPGMWTFYTYDENPKQRNGSDCGLYVIEAMNAIVNKRPYKNRNMKDYRCLVGRRLLGPIDF